MNKTPMNNDDHDWLDKILSGNDDYIHDGGFTGHVMSALPVRRRNQRPHMLIFGCAALLSLVFFLLSVPGLASLYAACIGFLRTEPLYNLATLAILLYAATGALTWWIIDPDS